MLSWFRNGGCSNSDASHRQKLTTVWRGLGAFALLCSVSVVVRAQDVPPGIIARLDVTQRLEYSDNPGLDVDGDSDFFGRTILGFGLESVTSIQRLALNLGTDIEEFRDDNDQDFDFDNSFANLDYRRQTRDAFARGQLRYRETDADSDFFDDDDIDQDGRIINSDEGTRVSYGFTLGGGVGQDAPIGASFNWFYNEINFEDTDDPDLNDSTRSDFSGQVDFFITPRVTTSLTGIYRDFDTDDPDGTDRETKGLGGAASFLVSDILTANIGLRYDRIERTGGTDRTDEGVSGNLGLTRALPNGSVGVNYTSDVFANDDGRRSFFSVNRDMDLPRGALFFSLGVTGADAVGSDPLIDANYRHDLPTGQLNFGLSQRVNVDDDDEENISSSLRASYNQQINNLSSYGINFSFFNRNELDDDGNDGQRYNLGLTYRYDLTRDWGLVSGITHTFSTEDDEEDRRRTTVFVGLQRSFNWNP